MQKLINLMKLSLILLVVFSCSQTEDVDVSNLDYDLESKIKLTSSTNFLTESFLNMGVEGIRVTKENNKIVFNNLTRKKFILNGSTIDLADYEIIFENEMLSFSDDKNTKVTFRGDLPYIISTDFTGSIENGLEFLNNDKIVILLLYMNELTSDIADKTNSIDYLSLKEANACGFWDTYYVYSTGGNRSVAEANLTQEIEHHAGGCTAIGGTNSSCMWGDHFCVISQAYCCE